MDGCGWRPEGLQINGIEDQIGLVTTLLGSRISLYISTSDITDYSISPWAWAIICCHQIHFLDELISCKLFETA